MVDTEDGRGACQAGGRTVLAKIRAIDQPRQYDIHIQHLYGGLRGKQVSVQLQHANGHASLSAFVADDKTNGRRNGTL